MTNKKIAVLTHFNVCNFGANMQAVSTSAYLRKNGWDPVFINWNQYQNSLFTNVPKVQQDAHRNFVYNSLEVSQDLSNEKEIIAYLNEHEIKNIIVGSDAVFCLSTWLDRFVLNRKGIHIKKFTPDKVFPNVFWLSELQSDRLFNIAMMSVSSQNAYYKLLSKKVKEGIKRCIQRYDYISVRDEWTQKMVYDIGDRNVSVTPDPMWAFETNYDDTEIEEDFLTRMHIKKPYLLLGFQYAYPEKSQKWLEKFVTMAHHAGFQCLPLPFAFGYMPFDYDQQIEFPLSPMDWYRLIKYSKGYIGYNMHPIIVSMANNVPCFSIDNYGINIAKFFNIKESSKIYDIFKRANRLDCRCNLCEFFYTSRYSPSYVFEKILSYDSQTGLTFAQKQRIDYNLMMNNILKLFEK